MSLARTLIGSILRKSGYQAVKTKYLHNINMTIHLKRLLTTQNVDVVFDVGANQGQYYDYLRQEVGYRGTILSFEPLSNRYSELNARHSSDRNWHVFPFALGDKKETQRINVMNADDMSSFLEPDVSSCDRFSDSNQVAKTESVDIERLDDIYADLASKHSIKRPYLKMDTQGFDMNVLKGGLNALPNFIALQTEAAVLPLYKGMSKYTDMIQFLESKGFELSGAYPVSVDDKLRLIEFDCFMVNTNKINPLAVEKR